MIYEIVLDSGETANKCTIAPLASRSDFSIFPTRGDGPIGPLTASVLLHHEGECLTQLKRELPKVTTIASIDCVWRRLANLTARVSWQQGAAPAQGKIPLGFLTAYPRVGLPHHDPPGGLATIEALFVATAILGEWDISLFSHYYFGKTFIKTNAARFLELGIPPQKIAESLSYPTPFERTALSRRRNRGRMPKTR